MKKETKYIRITVGIVFSDLLNAQKNKDKSGKIVPNS
jgi:hypothetical protein